MSIQGLGWAAAVTDLRGLAKFVLMALANYANEDGSCWPSQRALAEFTGQSERGVRRHLAALEKEGYISRESRKRARGGRTSDMYTLNWADWPQASRAAANTRGDGTVANEQHNGVETGNRTGQAGQAPPNSTGQIGQDHRPNWPKAPAKLAGPKEEPSLNHQSNQNARARGGGGSATGARRPQGAAPDANRGNGATDGAARKPKPFPPDSWPLWKRAIVEAILCDPNLDWDEARIRELFRSALRKPRGHPASILLIKSFARKAGVVEDLPDEFLCGMLDAKDHRTGTWVVSDEVLQRRGLTRPESPP